MSNAYRSNKGASAVLPTGDAVEANVLSGKTFSNALGTGKTGSMTNNGAVTQTIAPGGSYTIPEGYHNGSGVVTASQQAKPNAIVGMATANHDVQAGENTMTITQGSTGRVFGSITIGDKTTLTVTGNIETLLYFKKDGTSGYLSNQTGTIDVSDYVTVAFYFDASGARTLTLS